MRRCLYILCLVIVSSLIASSCNDVCSCKKVSCPAYKNVSFDQWFPYQTSQQIVFGDTAQKLPDDTIDISYVSAQEAYEANQGCGNGSSGCSSDKRIAGSAFSVSYSSSSDWDGTVVDSNYSFSLHDFLTSAESISPNGFISTAFPSFFYNSIRLNGILYQNVQTIYRTDTAGTNFDVTQVYLQNGTGLLAWRSQYAQTLFVRK